jgi:hypothetical protein
MKKGKNIKFKAHLKTGHSSICFVTSNRMKEQIVKTLDTGVTLLRIPKN